MRTMWLEFGTIGEADISDSKLTTIKLAPLMPYR